MPARTALLQGAGIKHSTTRVRDTNEACVHGAAKTRIAQPRRFVDRDQTPDLPVGRYIGRFHMIRSNGSDIERTHIVVNPPDWRMGASVEPSACAQMNT